METVQVRFRFNCKPGTVKFDRFHSIPSRLVDIADEDAEAREEHRQLWSETARHILEESKTDCLEHSPRICACGSPAVTTGQLPLLLLYGPERRVVVLVDPLCGHERCQTRLRQESLQLMSELRGYIGGQPLDTDIHVFTPVLRCNVCAIMEGVKRCGRCQAVAYCGKSHQRQDWAAHKAGCVPPHQGENRADPATLGPSSREMSRMRL